MRVSKRSHSSKNRNGRFRSWGPPARRHPRDSLIRDEMSRASSLSGIPRGEMLRLLAVRTRSGKKEERPRDTRVDTRETEDSWETTRHLENLARRKYSSASILLDGWLRRWFCKRIFCNRREAGKRLCVLCAGECLKREAFLRDKGDFETCWVWSICVRRFCFVHWYSYLCLGSFENNIYCKVLVQFWCAFEWVWCSWLGRLNEYFNSLLYNK